jgi:hypothetical protein
MTRFEMLGRLMNYLQGLDDTALEVLMDAISQDITDDTMSVITYGKDDTEHIEHSPVDAADLARAIEDLKDYKFITPEHAS